MCHVYTLFCRHLVSPKLCHKDPHSWIIPLWFKPHSSPRVSHTKLEILKFPKKMTKSGKSKVNLRRTRESRKSRSSINSNWASPRAGAWLKKTKSCLLKSCDWARRSSKLEERLKNAIWGTCKPSACPQETKSFLVWACTKHKKQVGMKQSTKSPRQRHKKVGAWFQKTKSCLFEPCDHPRRKN